MASEEVNIKVEDWSTLDSGQLEKERLPKEAMQPTYYTCGYFGRKRGRSKEKGTFEGKGDILSSPWKRRRDVGSETSYQVGKRRRDVGSETSYQVVLEPASPLSAHHKDGVRIAVGRVGISKIFALPGPSAGVRAGCCALIEGIERGLDDVALAESTACAVREHWLNHVGKG